jgi:flagellar basal-body rod protein FlgB
MKTGLFDELSGLEHVLDFQLARHSVLAANLANAETPGYKPHDLAFAEELAAATPEAPAVPGALPLSPAMPGFVEIEQTPTGPDGNGVRLEQAMASVSANRMRYNTALEIARRRIALLRYAVTGGGE